MDECECSLASLVSLGKTKKPITDKGYNVRCGEITIIAEELISYKEEMSLKFVSLNSIVESNRINQNISIDESLNIL